MLSCIFSIHLHDENYFTLLNRIKLYMETGNVSQKDNYCSVRSQKDLAEIIDHFYKYSLITSFLGVSPPPTEVKQAK